MQNTIKSLVDLLLQEKIATHNSFWREQKPSEAVRKECLSEARHSAEYIGYIRMPEGSELPDCLWEAIDPDVARQEYEARNPLLLYYAECWSVPSGASGESPCWAYVDQQGFYSNANWRSYAAPMSQAIFGRGPNQGYRFFRQSISE